MTAARRKEPADKLEKPACADKDGGDQHGKAAGLGGVGAGQRIELHQNADGILPVLRLP
ncbi:hypothetical protein D3C86_1219690 [compost metagenome]